MQRTLCTLQVGVQQLKVVYDPDLDGWGAYDPQTQSINISTLRFPELQLTVLHELLHAVDDMLGIKLSEQDVRCLEQILTLIVRDNYNLALGWVQAFDPEEKHEISTRFRDQHEPPDCTSS